MKQMKIICMGDSLTEGDYGIPGVRGTPNVKKENYPYFLSFLTGAEVKNYGKCGFRASQYLDLYRTGEFNVEGADFIIIMLGTNGGFDDKIDTPDNESFLSLLDSLENDAPSAKIVLCTPPHATSNKAYVNHGYMPQILIAREFYAGLHAIESSPSSRWQTALISVKKMNT